MVAGSGLEMSVNIGWGETLRQHQNLNVVQQLRNFSSRRVGGLVLSSHPHLGRLFNDLLTDCMDPVFEKLHRPGAVWAHLGLLGQFGKQLVERLHPIRVVVS